MPNARVGAAAEGMPKSSRRSFFATASVAVAASLPGCSLISPAAASILKAAPYVPADTDPLAALIAEYAKGVAEFSSRAAKEHWDELTPATYGPALNKLWHHTPEPTSLAGVTAAIRLALDEPDLHAVEPVLRACARYLERGAQT